MTRIISQSTVGNDGGLPRGPARLPDGRRLDVMKRDGLYGVLASANVPNISADMGKAELVKAYAAHLAAIRKEAGDRAEEAWREQHRPKAMP